MPTIYLRGANTTAQWYADNYPGSTFSRVDKFLIHTTETGGWPGYSAGASAPNATYYPKWRQIRQHFGINRSARALRDPSSTAVRENRDNVFQLEIICYSDYSLARSRGGLWVGDLSDAHMRDIAAMILQIHRDWNLPIQSSVTWREGRQTWYDNVRLSGSQFDAYRGILGHVHASGNTHWDPGGFRYSKLVKALQYQLVNHPVYGGGTTIPDPSVPGTGFDPEEDMAYGDWPYEHRQRLCNDVANYVLGRLLPSPLDEETSYPVRTYLRYAWRDNKWLLEGQAKMGAELGALKSLVGQLVSSPGQPLDMAAVEAAALKGAQQAMAELDVTIRVASEGTSEPPDVSP